MTRAVFLTLLGLSATALGGAVASAQRGSGGVSYPNCAAARAAGAAPIRRGEPGYSTRLDRDGDGIACEPYRGGGGGSFNRGRRRRSRYG